MNKTQTLQARLSDKRSKRVILLSHCILNENTRYLGGAGQRGCVKEIVKQCLDLDLGIVQMPCPEQHAWGGVTKRWLLMSYGAKGTLLYSLRHFLLPIFLLHTQRIYRRLAKATAGQINDYLSSGTSIIGVIGVDGSPSCGVNITLDIERSFELVARMEVASVTVEQMNAIVRQGLAGGSGLFTLALQKELEKLHIDLPYRAHNLLAEISGEISSMGAMLSS